VSKRAGLATAPAVGEPPAARVAPIAPVPAVPGDDRALVALAQQGDRGAFRSLFERYHRRAYALAFGVVRNQDDALDVVQDAFIKAHRHLDKFEGQASFYTWLYRIVMNLAIDHLRKHKRHKPVDFTDQALDESVSEDALLPKIIGGNPGRALLDKEIRGRIGEALGGLSENHRSVLVMRELEGLSYEEMATAMSCSKGTIMSRLFHARKNMQRQLADLYPGGAVDKDAGDSPEDGDAVESSTPDASS